MTIKLVLFIFPFIVFACQRDTSNVVGWDYNNPKNGGFKKVPFVEQETAPGMVLVEGGNYHIPGFSDNDTLGINSFYISKYEETNGQYLEYVNYLRKYYSYTTYQNALPDTTVWNLLDTTENVESHFINEYFRNWTYRDYPVVGLTPLQISKYAVWKTDRINEMILIREGVLAEDAIMEDSTDVFTTETYFMESSSPVVEIQDLNPDNVNRTKFGVRAVRMEDGLLLPRFRLPTQEEWQHAHLAIGDSNNYYRKTTKASFIKLTNFRFLNDVESPSRKTYPPEMKLKGLKKVYSPMSNVYKLKGLNSNVAEWVGDSVLLGVIGGSFLEGKLENRAVYDEEIIRGVKYRFRQAFQQATVMNGESTGIYGFRLAMDHVGSSLDGYGHHRKRRYRFKSKH